jgi:hypothetical protein
MMGAMSAIAQTGNYSVPISAGSGEKTMMVAGTPASDDPVGQVRNQRGWEYGPFINWGTGVGDRSDFKFLSAGFELGKVLTPVVHAGILSGQFQLAGNMMPLWQAYTPDVLWSQPHPGDFSLELRDQVAPDSTLVSGGGRIDLHHAQVSAQYPHEQGGGHQWRNVGVEFFAAGRGWNSLFHPSEKVN